MNVYNITVCTIIQRNYLAQARVLMDSVMRFEPEAGRVVLVVDGDDDRDDYTNEVFDVVFPENLINIDKWYHFVTKYTGLEVCTAIKPFFMEQLFEAFSTDIVIYLDPDIEIFHSIEPILADLDEHTMLLTPHILSARQDKELPNERDFLRLGCFNLGFVAVHRIGQWREILNWWKKHLYTECVQQQEQGVFLDQRWMDIVPHIFKGIGIFKHPGCNVAWWNYKERSLIQQDDELLVNGEVLIFFHYSGFNLETPTLVTHHLSSLTMDDMPTSFSNLFASYSKKLLGAGYEVASVQQYRFDTFSDGTPISRIARGVLLKFDPEGVVWQIPLDVTSVGLVFRDWITARVKDSYISHYFLAMHAQFHELQAAFPNVPGKDELRFASWIIGQSGSSNLFHEIYVAPIREKMLEESVAHDLEPLSTAIDLSQISISNRCSCGRAKPGMFS